MEKKYQIFISSTYEDLKDERRKVQDTILEMYQFPIGMEMFSASDEEQWEIIKETIDSSDFYVLIIGHKYGSVIKEGEYAGISYTQKEFCYALEQKIPILAFLIDKSVPIIPDKMEQDANKREKLEAFKDEVTNGRMVEWWTSKDDLANKVMNAINKQINRGKRPGWVRADTFNIEETQNELVKMSKRIRDLEKENEELKKSIIVRKPKFEFIINEGKELCYEYKNISVNYVKAEFTPLTEKDIENYKISQSEMDEYNRSLPTKEKLDEYLEEYKFYESMHKNTIPFKVEYRNIGNKKANDIHIHISFSKGLIIMSKEEINDKKEPERPITLENPINKILKQRMGLSAMEQVYDTLNNGWEIGKIKLPSFNTINSINYHENIKENKLVIWDRGMMHTEKECSDEYYLVPKDRGKYEIKISAICEEFEEEIIQEFEILVK